MTPALIMLVIPGLPSYNGVEVYYLKGAIGLPIVISFRDRGYIHIFFFFGNGLIDDVIVIGWTDSDFKISRALALYPYGTPILPIQSNNQYQVQYRRKP